MRRCVFMMLENSPYPTPSGERKAGAALICAQDTLTSRPNSSTASKRVQALLDETAFAHDVPSEVSQKVFDHHGDYRFIFDDEDAAGGHGPFGLGEYADTKTDRPTILPQAAHSKE